MNTGRWIGYVFTLLLSGFFGAAAVWCHQGNKYLMGVTANDGYAKFWLLVTVGVLAVGMAIFAAREKAAAICGNAIALLCLIAGLTLNVAGARPTLLTLGLLLMLFIAFAVAYQSKVAATEHAHH